MRQQSARQMPLSCSVNEQIGNILEALSWFPVAVFTNVLGLNRLLSFVSGKWANRLFGPTSTYVSDEERRRSKSSHSGVAGAVLGLWRALVHLLVHARSRHDVLLLVVGCPLRHEQEWIRNSCVTGRVVYSHSIQHQPHPLWTTNLLTAQEGALFLGCKTQCKRLQNATMGEAHQAGARRREASLSIQAALIVSFYWIATLYSHHSQKLVFLAQWRYSHALGNWLWIVTCTIDPIIYLSLNRCDSLNECASNRLAEPFVTTCFRC